METKETLIYNRTSTKEQNPELQKQDCLNFCREKKLNVLGILSEQGSAYKLDKRRPIWEGCVERAKKERLNIVVWRYDRAFRNRKDFFEFMKVMFEVYGVKIYSATEPSVLMFWDMIDKSNDIQDITLREFMKGQMKLLWELTIRQAGETAEEESRKKSQRVKLAVVREDKEGNKIKTESYKGKLWGRKPLSLNVINQVVDLRKAGKSIREISKLVTYWDKNNHSKNISVAGVHKIISKNNL